MEVAQVYVLNTFDLGCLMKAIAPLQNTINWFSVNLGEITVRGLCCPGAITPYGL